MILRRWLSRAESLYQVDPVATWLRDRLREVLDGTRADQLLRGSWLGHPVHPLLVTVPIGAWTSAAVLDALPGQDVAARRLLGLGLSAAVPTALTGLTDYSELGLWQRRVGVVHAVASWAAIGCFGISYLRRGHQVGRGRVSTLLGLAMIAVGGALGGHLSYAQGAGVFRWQPQRATFASQEAEQAQRITSGIR